MSDRDRDQSVEQWLRRRRQPARRPDACLDADTLAAWTEGLLDGAGAIARRSARIELRALPGDAGGHGPDDARAGVGRGFADPQVAHDARPGVAAAAAVALWFAVDPRPETRTVGPRRTEQGARGDRSRSGACAEPAASPLADKDSQLRDAHPDRCRDGSSKTARCTRGSQTSARQRRRACRRRETRGRVQREEMSRREPLATPIAAEKRSGGAVPRRAPGCRGLAPPPRSASAAGTRTVVSGRQRGSASRLPRRRTRNQAQSNQRHRAESEPRIRSGAASRTRLRAQPPPRQQALEERVVVGRLARSPRGRQERRRCAGRVRWFSPALPPCSRFERRYPVRSLARRRWPSRAAVARRRSDLGDQYTRRRGRDSDGRRGAVDDRVLARRPRRRHRSHDRWTSLAACAVSRAPGLHGRRRRLMRARPPLRPPTAGSFATTDGGRPGRGANDSRPFRPPQEIARHTVLRTAPQITRSCSDAFPIFAGAPLAAAIALCSSRSTP